MYIRLIRNKPQGNAITGRLVINGRWFCYTLERVGYQIPALCYHVAVTQSPKFKRLLPLVQNVPASPKSSPKGKDFNSEEELPSLQGGVGVGLPIALGVIRNVEEESYDMAVNEQINEVREKSKVKTFDQLTQTLEQWEVNH